MAYLLNVKPYVNGVDFGLEPQSHSSENHIKRDVLQYDTRGDRSYPSELKRQRYNRDVNTDTFVYQDDL